MKHGLVALSLGLSLAACGGVVASDGVDPPSTRAAPEEAGPWTASAACTPLGPVAKRLAELADASPEGIVPNGPEVWFTALDGSSRMSLYHLATAGGAPVLESSAGRIGASFAISESNLAVVRITPSGPSSWLESLVVRDRKTGAETNVTTPSKQRIMALRATASGLYYAAQDPSTVGGSIAFFDGTNARAVSSLQSPLSFVTDGREVFYVRYDATGKRALEAASQDGSSPRVLRDFGANIRNVHRVIGVNGSDIFVARTAPIGHGTFEDGEVLAIRKDGSGERVVVTIPGFVGNAIVDPDYVTWTDGIAAKTILRARLTGGPIERIEAGGYVRALVADACNLYWTTNDPNAIHARSRLP